MSETLLIQVHILSEHVTFYFEHVSKINYSILLPRTPPNVLHFFKKMDKIEPFLNELTILFQEMITNRNNPSQNLLDNIKKQGQFLAACLKRVPEASTNEKVMELLGLYSAPSKRDHPKIYPTSSSLVDLCFKNISPSFLSQMWDLTDDIGLCEMIIKNTAIESDAVFNKIFLWIQNPNSDSTFLAHFLAILGSPTESEVGEELISKIAPLLVDSSPLRSSLASLALLSFDSISQNISYIIIASWLQCKNRRIQSAYNCRRVLELAPTNVLNYAATLCLEFPIILCILPTKAMGFQSLASITLHRIISLVPDALVPFIELCDQTVRTLLFTKILKKEDIDPNEIHYYPPLKLYDASSDPEIRISDLFGEELTSDLIASATWFARMTIKSDITIDNSIKKQIFNILQSPVETNRDTPSTDIPTDRIFQTNEKIQEKNFADLRTMVESPVVYIYPKILLCLFFCCVR